MKKSIVLVFAVLFVFWSIPLVSYANSEQQIPSGVLAQLLDVIQGLVDKMTELQQLPNNTVSVPLSTETSPRIDYFVSPATNDIWQIGTVHKIEWIIDPQPDEVSLHLLRDGFPNYEVPITEGSIKNTGSFNWTVGPLIMDLGKDFRVEVRSKAYGLRSNLFQITRVTPTPTVVISKDSSSPTSRITLVGQSSVELHRIGFDGRGSDLTLKKLTLQLVRANKRLWTLGSVSANFGQIYLYDGTTLVGSGVVNPANGKVAFSGLNLTLLQGMRKVLGVKADITGSGTLKDNSTLAFWIPSTSVDEMEIYGPNGLLPSRNIRLQDRALSNFNLYKSVAPSVINAMSNGIKTPGVNQEIAKFTITNVAPPGGRSLRFDRFEPTVLLSGSCTESSTVSNFKLYDGGTVIGVSPLLAVLNCGSSLKLYYDASDSGWGTQEIPAGGSKTYTIKADTTNIRNGVPSGTSVYLSSKVDGLRGYNSRDFTGPEYYWNTGDVKYNYTTAGIMETHKNNKASDSYSVQGATLTY